MLLLLVLLVVVQELVLLVLLVVVQELVLLLLVVELGESAAWLTAGMGLLKSVEHSGVR